MKWLCRMIVIALLLVITGVCALSETTFDGTKVLAAKRGVNMKVVVEATCDDYNHVGKDWTKMFYVNQQNIATYLNDKLLNSAPEIVLSAGETIFASADFTEEDKYPDEGSSGVSYDVTQDDLKDGFDIAFDVSVIENGGRYSGCEAIWNVKLSFYPQQ